MSSWMASKTTLNLASYFFSKSASLRANSTWLSSILRNATKARMISMLVRTARLLRRTLESIETPCSVNA